MSIHIKTNMFTITKLLELCEGRRKIIQIDKNTLMALLMDHSKMYDALINDSDLEVTTPEVDKDYYDGKDEKGRRVAGKGRVRLKQKKTTKPVLSKKPKRVRL